MVERRLPKANVAGSSPVFRSKDKNGAARYRFWFCDIIYTGLEAALRKRAGGSFSAVTEEFCKA